MIHTYLRITEDWGSVTMDDLQYWENENAEKHTNVPYFNRWCALSWFEFRRRIKEIATNSWKRQGLSVLQFDFMQDHLLADFVEDDDFVISTDDDDWFHPDLVEIVEKEGKDHDIVLWDSMVFRSAGYYQLHSYYQHHPHIPCSNGFAIRGSYGRRAHEDYHGIFCHGYVMDIARKTNARVKDLRTDKPWSLYNWHPGSMSVLNGIKDYMDIPKLLPNNSVPDYPLDWGRQEYEEFVDVVESLRPRHSPLWSPRLRM